MASIHKAFHMLTAINAKNPNKCGMKITLKKKSHQNHTSQKQNKTKNHTPQICQIFLVVCCPKYLSSPARD